MKLLVLTLIRALPNWNPHRKNRHREWGSGRRGGIGLLGVVLIILARTQRIAARPGPLNV
jgi:hypothetical protein